jgi:phospholipid/cholesterol/gamma-HCH transport system substrate-binding protein
MTNINSIVDDPIMRDDLKRSLRELPQTLRDANVTLGKANAAFDSMQQAGDRATKNLANLENLTKPLGERGPQIVDNFDGTLANMNELLEQLVTFTENLNNRQGTLGRIMNDDTIYLRLERTLANAEDLTARLKPIMDDFRIVSDKLARDPRLLGLKGAMDRRPLGVGGKSAPQATGGHDVPIFVESNAWDPVIVP